jgi:hypothetical protein
MRTVVLAGRCLRATAKQDTRHDSRHRNHPLNARLHFVLLSLSGGAMINCTNPWACTPFDFI